MFEVVDSESPSTRPGPGAELRGAREAQGREVRDVARALRLDPAVIRALESDDFAALPAPIFVKGYLSAYCKLLGIASDGVLADYARAAGNTAPPPLVVSRGTGDGVEAAGGPGRVVGVVVVLLVIAVAAVALVTRFPLGNDNNGADSAASATPAPARISRQQALPQPRPSADSQAQSQPAVADEVAEEPADGNTAAATPSERIPGNVHLRFTFTSDSWTEVTDANGRRLFFGLARSGRTIEVEGRAPVVVFLGNAPGVTLMVNDAPFNITPFIRDGNVARLTLAAEPPR